MNKLDKIRVDIEKKYEKHNIKIKTKNDIPNSKNRITATFSINADLMRKLRKYCKEEGYLISTLIEKGIEKQLEVMNKSNWRGLI